VKQSRRIFDTFLQARYFTKTFAARTSASVFADRRNCVSENVAFNDVFYTLFIDAFRKCCNCSDIFLLYCGIMVQKHIWHITLYLFKNWFSTCYYCRYANCFHEIL